jgi:hypothetical protein
VRSARPAPLLPPTPVPTTNFFQRLAGEQKNKEDSSGEGEEENEASESETAEERAKKKNKKKKKKAKERKLRQKEDPGRSVDRCGGDGCAGSSFLAGLASWGR